MKVISRRGVQLERKFASLENPIYTIDNPDEIMIPVLNGDIDQLEVKYQVGDYVQQYAEILRDNKGFSIFAPYCGTYMGLHTQRHDILGNRPFIKFHSKPGLAGSPFKPVDSEHLTGDEIIAISRRSGIVDELDNVPLYQKLENYKNNGVTILICDAIEDEVYSTSAFARMIEFGEEAAKGLKLAARACNTSNMKIAVSMIQGFKKSIANEYAGIQTLRVSGKYPVRHELYTSKRKKICAIGVGACIELYQAVEKGQCHTNCVVTVDGDCVKRPANLCVPIGTSIKTLFDTCKLEDTPDFYIVGDVMNGRTITDTDIAVTADMTCVLAVKANPATKKDICIHCGSCVNNCPSHLLPYRISEALSNDNYKELSFLMVDKCIECGVCSFLCPCGIDVKRDVAIAKEKTADYLESIRNIKAEVEEFAKPIIAAEDIEHDEVVEASENIVVTAEQAKEEQPVQVDIEQNAAENIEAETVEPLMDDMSQESVSDEDESIYEAEENQQNVYLYTPEDTSDLDELKQAIDASDIVHTVELDENQINKDTSEAEFKVDFESFISYEQYDNADNMESIAEAVSYEQQDDTEATDIFNLDFDGSEIVMQMNDETDELIAFEEPVDAIEESQEEQIDDVQIIEDINEYQPEPIEDTDDDKASGFKRWFGGIFAKNGKDKNYSDDIFDDTDQTEDNIAETNDEDIFSQFEQAVNAAMVKSTNDDNIYTQSALDEVEESNVEADADIDEIDYSTFDFAQYGFDDDDEQTDDIGARDIEYELEHLIEGDDDEQLLDFDITADTDQTEANELYSVDYSIDGANDEFDWLSYSPIEVSYSSLSENTQDDDIATTTDLLEEQYLKDMEKIDNFIDYDAEISDLEIDFDSIVKSAFDEINLFDNDNKGEGE